MYMTRVRLDSSKRKTMEALANPNLMHGAVEHAFTDYGSRHLWRIDPLHGVYYLLIVSEIAPDTAGIVSQFGMEPASESSAVRAYTPFLDKIQQGSRWHFRIAATPTHSVSQGEGKRGKVYPHVSPRHQIQWLIDQGRRHGFEVSEDAVQILQDRQVTFRKGEQHRTRVSMIHVVFEGTLKVTDADAFREALVKGIGREKAFGSGMLTIAGEIR